MSNEPAAPTGDQLLGAACVLVSTLDDRLRHVVAGGVALGLQKQGAEARQSLARDLEALRLHAVEVVDRLERLGRFR